MDDKLITISELYYDRLRRAEFKLQCLEAGGVNNWEWYSESLIDGGFYKDEEEDE